MRTHALAMVAALATLLATQTPAAAAPLNYVQVLTGDAQAGDRLPLIIALHDDGSTPGQFAAQLRGLPIAARVIVPRAPVPDGRGWAWFSGREPDQGAALRRAVARVAALAAEMREEYPTEGRPVAVGFGRGGDLALALALTEPEGISLAVPIGAAPLDDLDIKPTAGEVMPPIHAFHGAQDSVRPFTATRASLALLSRAGHDIQLHAYADTDHELSRQMRSDVFDLLEVAVGFAFTR